MIWPDRMNWPDRMDWLTRLFDTSPFPPRWSCGEWPESLGWTHIAADSAIFVVFLAIPMMLAYFVRQRRDLPFPWVLILFAAFILVCGIGHLIEAIIFYRPIYAFAGMWKVVIAVVSWVTFFALIPAIPKLLALRSPTELEGEIGRREVAENELRQANQELEGFARVASHDLKAPIRAIAMTTQFLREDIDDRDAVAQHLDALDRRARRMENLVRGLLDVARAGEVIGKVERVDVCATIRDVLDSLGEDHAERVSVHCDAPPLTTYRLGLEQVLMNLISNGLKHSKRDRSVVEVHAHRDPDDPEFILVRIEDDGPGIEPEYRERIFGMFETLESRDAFESTGIGLTVVKKLTKAVGARIQVVDGELGGAAFHLRWPIGIPTSGNARGVG